MGGPGGNFAKSNVSNPRQGSLDPLKAQPPAFHASRFGCPAALEKRHRRGEFGWSDTLTSLLLPLEKVGQSQLDCPPDCGFKALPNHLAADYLSAIVIAIAGVLRQMRHIWKRAPPSVTGKVFFPFTGLRSGIRLGLHNQKLRAAKEKVGRRSVVSS